MSGIFPYIVIPILLLIAIAIFKFVLGNPANFADNDPTKDPLPGNFMGQMYKGGFMVPILITAFFHRNRICH